MLLLHALVVLILDLDSWAVGRSMCMQPFLLYLT